MNNVLAQAHTSSVRADRDAELGSHQQNSENLAHTSKADRVDLADVDGLDLEKLLEDHPVVCVLTGRDANTIWLESLPDGGMAEDIIWSSRFLDEPRGWKSRRPYGDSNGPHTKA